MYPMADLSTTLCGVRLKNPLISGAGPNNKNFDTLKLGVDAGFGAVVSRGLHLITPEHVREPSRGFWKVFGNGRNYRKDVYSFQSAGTKSETVNPHASPGFGGCARFPSSLQEWEEEVARMCEYAHRFDTRVIGAFGFCGTCLSTDELWDVKARLLARAGVDMLQLHTAPSPPTDTGRCMQYEPEKYLANPIRIVKAAAPGIPIMVKIPNDCCDALQAAFVAQDAGADAVVLTGRWMSVTVEHNADGFDSWGILGYGGPWSLPILCAEMQRLLHPERVKSQHAIADAITPKAITTPLRIPMIVSGGVRDGRNVMDAVLCGATAMEICAQVLTEGHVCVERILKETNGLLDKRGVKTLMELRDKVRFSGPPVQRLAVVDPGQCIGCKSCVSPCMNEAIRIDDNKAHVEAERCEGCGSCYYACPTNAIRLEPLRQVSETAQKRESVGV
jgi:dihydroorotate dehydrogenase